MQKRLPRPSWRSADGRAARPELWLASAALVSMLLVEVWQNSHMAELSLELDRNRTALNQAHARLEFVRADVERRTTRAELAPLAARLGLAPTDAGQIVGLPSEYLADSAPLAEEGPPATSWMAWVERASTALVPEARAKGRLDR